MRAVEAQTNGASTTGDIDDTRSAGSFPKQGREVIAHQLCANGVGSEAGCELLGIGAFHDCDTGIVD